MAKPLKILIISAFFPPQNSIGGQRPYSFAKYWSRMGHSVDVLTTAKDEIDLDTYEDFTVYEVKASGFFNFLRFF